MARIVQAGLALVDLKPMVQRTDATQSFASQENPIVTLTDDEAANPYLDRRSAYRRAGIAAHR